jgi:hypothetical protein
MVYRGETVAGVTLLDRQEAVRDLESRLRRALLIARLGGERLVSRDGRLEILRSLGHGASGVVCEALDRKLGRKVALKLYPGIAQDRLAAAVRTEAQTLAALKHRNIVVVHDFDAEEFRPGEIRCFLVVMELLSGTTLRHWMAEPHLIGDIVEVFCRAGDGLAAAHAREIVHRDFKPKYRRLSQTAPQPTERPHSHELGRFERVDVDRLAPRYPALPQVLAKGWQGSQDRKPHGCPGAIDVRSDRPPPY